MPIVLKDLNDGLGIVVKAWGILSEDEFIEVLKKHLTQEEEKFKKYRYTLLDWTGVTKTDVSANAVSLIAEYCKRSALINPESVVAHVADKEVAFGLARMWESLSRTTKWETMVFRNRAEAETWIKEKIKHIYGIDDPGFN